LLLGLVVFPAGSRALGLLARRYPAGPPRFTGPAAGAAALFYGATLLVAAGRRQAGCEFTVLSNVILGRDDQVGCPRLTPLDQAEARIRGGIPVVDGNAGCH
jgi:hypothetical protein